MLWNYLTGYVIIQIEGMGLERFLNRMLCEGVAVWDVSREKDGTLTALVSVAGFYALHRLNARGARIRIRKKGGLLPYLSRLRRRKVLLYGWIAVLLGLCWASRLLWVVEITGCDRVPESAVRETLSAAGARPGVARRRLRTGTLRDAVIASDERIAMATATVSGVVLRLCIREAEDAPDMVEDSPPADVVAERDGLLLTLTARKGRAMASPGDVVRAGDVLISGTLTREIGGEAQAPILVRARGEAMARVAYTFGAAAETEEAALRLAEKGFAEIDPKAVIVEKTGKITRNADGTFRAVIAVVAEEDIAKARPIG